MTLKLDVSRNRILKNPHCLTAVGADNRSKLQPITGNCNVYRGVKNISKSTKNYIQNIFSPPQQETFRSFYYMKDNRIGVFLYTLFKAPSFTLLTRAFPFLPLTWTHFPLWICPSVFSSVDYIYIFPLPQLFIPTLWSPSVALCQILVSAEVHVTIISLNFKFVRNPQPTKYIWTLKL